MTPKFVSNPAAPAPSTTPEFVIKRLPNQQSKSLLLNQVAQVCIATRPVVLRDVFLVAIWSGLTVYWRLYPRLIDARYELLSTHRGFDAPV